MKYLKMFEHNLTDMSQSEIEEVFYNISDNYFVEVQKFHVSNKTKLKVTIGSGKLKNIINLNDIEDDLKFAINYLSNKTKLKLDEIYIQGKELNGSYINKNYNSKESVISINDLLNDTKGIIIVIIKLYFR